MFWHMHTIWTTLSVSIELVILFLSFFLLTWCITLMIVYVELFLHPRDKSHFPLYHFSYSVVSSCLQPHGPQHARPPCPLPTPGLYSNSSPLSLWCHSTISSSVVPFSSSLQSFPESRSFQISQFFALGGQSIGVSASASVLPMDIQNWFPLGLTGLIFLQSKGLSRVFSNTTVQKHQFFSNQLSL